MDVGLDYFNTHTSKMTTTHFQAITNEIENCPALAHMTKKTLKCKLGVLSRTEHFPHDLVEKVVPLISVNGRLGTDIAYMTACLSMCHHSRTFKNLIGRAQIRQLQHRVTELKDVHTKQMVGLRDTDLDWKTIQSFDHLFPKGSEARLIYLLYTRISNDGGVQRADYTPMKIVDTEEEAEQDETINYLVKSPPTFIFNVYKTANRYHQKTVSVPPEVMEEVPLHQTWLFEFNRHPIVENTLSMKVIRAFRKYAGTKCCINTLRRSYARHTMSMENQSEYQKREMAFNSDHNLSTHMRYAGRVDV